MKSLSSILFPAAVASSAIAGAFGLGSTHAGLHEHDLPVFADNIDTVVYARGGYKLRRVGNFEEIKIADSLLGDGSDTLDFYAAVDTLPHLTARDTIPVPDSLRLTDPFRFKYYVALIDSLTHTIVRDSLKHRYDSLHKSYLELMEAGDSIPALQDSLLARLDSIDWRKVDSTYLADSTAAAIAKELAYYNSLDRKGKKKYDMEKMLPIKLHEMDSLRKVKEKKQAEKDSIIEYTPRILESFAFPDSMQYKRIVTWNVDQDFHRIAPFEPDTSYNYHFYDYPYLRKDVNASWLGVAGSPLQPYNWFLRDSKEGVEFYDAMESWSYSPSTAPQYNTKTPHTELCYFGTLLGSSAKESDNLHLLSTQNITPALNLTLEYDRFGGGGFLENEKTINKTGLVGLNYLGKKYMAHGGFIYNMVSRGENGGVQDIGMIRDTTVNSREIDVNLKKASSLIKKKTLYLDQQYRIPFNFIEKIKAKKDTTYIFDADSLNKDITTAFIGHSTEFSKYMRNYNDEIGSYDTAAKEFYNNVFNINPTSSADSMGVTRLDNKVFLRLQPWSSESIVSKIDVGVGDYWKRYFDNSQEGKASRHNENSFYMYAGAEGQLKGNMNWDAKAHYVLLGTDFGNLDVSANAAFRFYPFRRARKSPVEFSARFSTALENPTFYQRKLYTNHYSWDNDFNRISTTRVEGRVNIPYWKLDASLGYALLDGNIYYDGTGVVQQNSNAMSVLSAYLRKEFVIGNFLHLDNKALVQLSSNQDVLPLPTASFNLRYYIQFVAQRSEDKSEKVLEMQIGVNAFYNTKWYAPAWNPAVGVFHNQSERLYNNGPYFDIFVNMQWKRACLFLKYQNFGTGWPMEKKDYFSADRYIGTQDGTDGLKLGIYWPFYISPHRNPSINK